MILELSQNILFVHILGRSILSTEASLNLQAMMQGSLPQTASPIEIKFSALGSVVTEKSQKLEKTIKKSKMNICVQKNGA